MKVNILNNHEVVLVDVGKDATNIRVEPCILHGFKTLNWEVPGNPYCDDLLPEGIDWSILGPGTASQVSEEDAKGIVEENPGLMMPMKYRHYGKPHYHYCDTAIQSLFTYIRANGQKPETTIVIFKPAKQ